MNLHEIIIDRDKIWVADADRIPALIKEEVRLINENIELSGSIPEIFSPVDGGYKLFIKEHISQYGDIIELWEYELHELGIYHDDVIEAQIDHTFKDILDEKTYKDLRRDAPNYLRIRDKSKRTPGSFYRGIEGDVLKFTTKSHTKPGVTYEQKVRLLSLEDVISKYRGRKKPQEIVRMAIEGDIEVHCTDPSWLYWGFQYIGTKDKYATDPEPRYPKIRNPQLKGSVCKHLDNVLFILPFQASKVAKDLIKQDRL